MKEIDDRLNKLPKDVQTVLSKIREVVKNTIPDATECISYGMPAFKYKGKYLIAYEAFKNHMSVFPGATPVDEIKEKLGNHAVSKGTIKFTLDDPLDMGLVVEMVKLRVRDIDSKV